MPRFPVATLHSRILHHHLALAGGVSGGDPDLVHLHSLLAAVLLTSLAETTEKHNDSVVNILHSHSYSLPAAAAAFLLFVIVNHLAIDYLHPRMKLKVHLYHYCNEDQPKILTFLLYKK